MIFKFNSLFYDKIFFSSLHSTQLKVAMKINKQDFFLHILKKNKGLLLLVACFNFSFSVLFFSNNCMCVFIHIVNYMCASF